MIYMFLANGFEEVEALTPLDLIRRADLPIKTVGIGGTLITGSHGITVTADMTDAQFEDRHPDMIILPGGMPGTKNLNASPVVQRAIANAHDTGAYLAAICAAPLILGRLGLLSGKEAICFPGFEEELKGARISERSVVKDGRVITAKGMDVALPFGLQLVECFKGREAADALKRAIMAE